MILVILAICLVLIVGGCIIYNVSYNFEEVGAVVGGVGTLCGVIALIVTSFFAIEVSQLAVVDDKIAMYQEENAKIEMQIAEAVEKYQDYESGIFGEVAPETSITFVSLYPELKADTLVQKQIAVYVENNDKIKNLKETQINGKIYRWWLYFGDNEAMTNE